MYLIPSFQPPNPAVFARLNPQQKLAMQFQLTKPTDQPGTTTMILQPSTSTVSVHDNDIFDDTMNILSQYSNQLSQPPRQTLTTNKRKDESQHTNIAAKRPAKSESSRLLISTNRCGRNDFDGMSDFGRNAGASEKGLAYFKEKALSSQGVALAIIWADSLTSNHANCSSRFCTPSMPCDVWHCTCDRQLRIAQAHKPLLGAVVVFTEEENVMYFLPLMETERPPSEMSACGETSDSTSEGPNPRLPLRCGTSVGARWAAFIDVLNDCSELILFNAQLALLPIFGATTYSPSRLTDTPFRFWSIRLFDPRIAAYLCDSEVAEIDLELTALLTQNRVVVDSDEMSTITGTGTIGLGKIARYVKQLFGDLRALIKLRAILIAKIDSMQLMQACRELEMPLVALLSSMEFEGIRINIDYLNSVADHVRRAITEITREACHLAGRTFNLASPDQVASVLYDQLGLPKPAGISASSRHASTSEPDLVRIKHMHPMVDKILQFRGLSKILSTYTDGMRPFLYKHKNVSSGADIRSFFHPDLSPATACTISSNLSSSSVVTKIHACWNQAIVRTGRLSCSKPNLQNIPNEHMIHGLDINLRSMFRASDGCLLVSADYSQIEMRVMAHISKDRELQRLFSQRGDVYRIMAARILRKQIDAVSDEERNRAKVICLGTMYGMGPQAASQKLEIPLVEATAITNSFFESFRQVKPWMQRIKALGKQVGYVCTLAGKRRHLPGLADGSQPQAVRAQAERQAVNSVIQGSASDLIKYAMLDVAREIAKTWVDSGHAVKLPKLLLQIHDELIYEVPAAFGGAACGDKVEEGGGGSVAAFVSILRNAMEKVVVDKFSFSVPLVANISVGEDWGHLSAAA